MRSSRHWIGWFDRYTSAHSCTCTCYNIAFRGNLQNILCTSLELQFSVLTLQSTEVDREDNLLIFEEPFGECVWKAEDKTVPDIKPALAMPNLEVESAVMYVQIFAPRMPFTPTIGKETLRSNGGRI